VVTIHRSECWLDFHIECNPNTDQVEVTTIMTRALEQEVFNAEK